MTIRDLLVETIAVASRTPTSFPVAGRVFSHSDQACNTTGKPLTINWIYGRCTGMYGTLRGIFTLIFPFLLRPPQTHHVSPTTTRNWGGWELIRTYPAILSDMPPSPSHLLSITSFPGTPHESSSTPSGSTTLAQVTSLSIAGNKRSLARITRRRMKTISPWYS